MNDKFVLLVEDNDDDVVLTQTAFRRCRVPNKLIAVYDGQEALDFLFGQGKYTGRDISRTPAVILLDLKLPYVSGQEVLRQIRVNENAEIKQLPVVVLSSTTNLREIADCEELGISRYFHKPGNFNEFKKIIDDVCKTWLM